MSKNRPLSRFLSCKKNDSMVQCGSPSKNIGYFSYCKKIVKDHNNLVQSSGIGFICSDRQLNKILTRCTSANLNRTDAIQRVKNFLYLLRYSKFSNSYHKDNDLLPDGHPCKKTSSYESFLFDSRSEAEKISKKIGLDGVHSTIISGQKKYVPGKHFQEISSLLRGNHE